MQLDFLLERIAQTVESHRLSEGAYARWLYKNGTHERDCAPNEYGCADAANLLYTIGAFVREPQARAKWVATLQGMQAAATGLFCERDCSPCWKGWIGWAIPGRNRTRARACSPR